MAKSKPIRGHKIIQKDIFVSVIVVANPETKDFSIYISDLSKLLGEQYENYEILVIDNCMKVAERAAVTEKILKLPCIRLIRLSRQYQEDTAIFAGVEAAVGDYVIIVNPELDPVMHIPCMIDRNQGFDIIQGVSTRPITGVFGMDLGRRVFYWYNRRYLGLDIPLRSTYFISLSRRAVIALVATNHHDRHIRHLVQSIGYSSQTYDYEPLKDPGKQRGIRTSVLQALEIVSAYSTHPLRFVTWLGFVAGIINLIYATYVVVVLFFKQDIAPGWTTLSLQLSFMFFILFTVMIVLSEYIGRILSESRRDPRYLITEEISSPVTLANGARRNISK